MKFLSYLKPVHANTKLSQIGHRFMFINSDSVFFDFSKNIENMWLSGISCTVCRIGNPIWFADGFKVFSPVLLLNMK